MLKDDDVKARISDIDFGFKMEPEIKAAILRDVGLYYKRRDLVKLAESTFDEALQENPECFQSLYEKSRCQLQTGHPNQALESAESCIEHYPRQIRAHHHRNECLFEQNEFEESLVKIARTRYDFPTVQGHQDDGRDVVQLTIEETIGASKGPCLLNMRKDIERYDAYRKSNIIDDRPMWKVLREKGMCDVVSVLEKPQPYISKIKKYRDMRKKSNMHILYMGLQTSKDILFLEHLEKEKKLMLNHTQNFNKKVGEIISTCLKEVRDFEQMLRHRRPVYAAQDASRLHKVQEFAENALTRIQAKTRNEAFVQLVEIRRLASCTDMLALRIYVDNVRDNFYSIKTKRLFPRKFEFLSEIFNIVGLAYLRNAVNVPSNVMLHQAKEQLMVLLQLPHDKKSDYEAERGEHFGDKRYFVDPTAPDYGFRAYKQRNDILDKEIQRCRYPIEGCYLCYELAHLHIAHGNLEEPKQLANKLLAFADKCGNAVWTFLGYLTSARADLASGQVVGCGQKLDLMYGMVENFDEMVGHFVRTSLVLLENRVKVDEQ